MSKIKSDSLTNFCWVMGSDDDQPIVMEIYAGFDERERLVVSLDNYDYEDPRYNCSTWVTVNKEDALALARRKKVKYPGLPYYISSCMEEWQEIVNADFRQLRACFKEITECFLDEGCRFYVGRTYGPHEWMCY